MVLGLTAALAVVLAALGPPSQPAPVRPIAAAEPAVPVQRPASAVAEPAQALLQPAPDFPGAFLPRIGPNGRVSRLVYARPAPPADKRPRIALLVTGFGLSDSDSQSAMAALPGPISLAFTPYGSDLDRLGAAARQAGHELLVSIPMEPDGYPLNDAGTKSLLTGASPAQNAANLEWALSRMQGYVGVTGAMEGMRGERFAALTSSLSIVLDDLKSRGLLYVDPIAGHVPELLPPVPGRAVDLVVDDPPARADLEGKLAALERIAREKGSALGLAGPLRPVVVERIASWAKGLEERGFVLVPVSALVNAAGAPAGKTSEAVR